MGRFFETILQCLRGPLDPPQSSERTRSAMYSLPGSDPVQQTAEWLPLNCSRFLSLFPFFTAYPSPAS